MSKLSATIGIGMIGIYAILAIVIAVPVVWLLVSWLTGNAGG